MYSVACIYIYIYTCIFVSIHIHTYMHMHTHTHVSSYFTTHEEIIWKKTVDLLIYISMHIYTLCRHYDTMQGKDFWLQMWHRIGHDDNMPNMAWTLPELKL